MPLAWLYAGLIVYASLYPFDGWRVPGTAPLQFLGQAWPRWWTGFDLVSNLLGYLPLGALLLGALVRSGWGLRTALAVALAAGTGLSFAMELLQNYLPHRVPSNVDLALNALGTLAGAALGALVHLLGGLGRWQTLRERWFIDRSAGGLVLLVLWPVGLLFPAPVPLGLGQVMGRVRELLGLAVADTPLEPWAEPWLAAPAPLDPLSPGVELGIVTLGLLAPCLVACTIARPGWRRLVLVLGAVALGATTTTLSTALNFGPDHALAWRTPNTAIGMALGLAMALPLAALPNRVAAGLGLVVLTALALLVAGVPADPYFAQSLQAWEQGRFIRFHGAARWVGWLWPYVALIYLLMRVGARRDEAAG